MKNTFFEIEIQNKKKVLRSGLQRKKNYFDTWPSSLSLYITFKFSILSEKVLADCALHQGHLLSQHSK